jgi:hypothetical protein
MLFLLKAVGALRKRRDDEPVPSFAATPRVISDANHIFVGQQLKYRSVCEGA